MTSLAVVLKKQTHKVNFWNNCLEHTVISGLGGNGDLICMCSFKSFILELMTFQDIVSTPLQDGWRHRNMINGIQNLGQWPKRKPFLPAAEKHPKVNRARKKTEFSDWNQVSSDVQIGQLITYTVCFITFTWEEEEGTVRKREKGRDRTQQEVPFRTIHSGMHPLNPMSWSI